MPFTTKATARKKAGIPARMIAWIGRHQSELSDRIHAAGDEQARRNGWIVIKGTGRFGFGTCTYRDPRFDDRRRQLSAEAAQASQRQYGEPSRKGSRTAQR